MRRDEETRSPGTIGDRVRSLRHAKGWSLEELAHRVGLGRNAVWELETNRRDQVRQANLKRYAEVLEVSVEYLLTGQTSPGALPPFEDYLRRTSDLDSEQIGHVHRTFRAMQAERELAEIRSRRAAYDQRDLADEMRREGEDLS